jgi:hypothetical protein
MSFLYFLKLVLKNVKWSFFPLAQLLPSYSTEVVIYTGIASGYSLSGSSK